MTNEEVFNNGLAYYLERGHTIDSMRDDIQHRSLAISLGYTVKYGKNFGEALIFIAGDKHIWYCSKGWACAELIGDTFCNHRYHSDLKEALEREALPIAP